VRVARRASSRAWFGGYGSGLAQSLLIAVVSGGLLWLVMIYSHGLRDPRYLDGWVLAVGMGVQVSFYVARKSRALSPRMAAWWRSFHILLGYVLIAAFVSHSDFSLPDTGFEWALWTSFVLVAASGIFGTYLAWFMQARLGAEERMSLERIAIRRAELARDVQAAVATNDPAARAIALPAAPYDDWILDFYTVRLKKYFAEHRNYTAHLVGSQRPLKELMAEMDALSKYLDRMGESKLAYIKTLVAEKDRLDFARVYNGLTRTWLLIHVPATYVMTMLTILHVVVVYAFSSGAF
jgi:hypothetical protein